MKKNKMMRLASALLVAVLLTTCTISGTYAKYVTSDSAKDSARVAKWGVTVVTAGEETFKNEYDGTVGLGTDDLVAPGTTNAEGVSFSITGQPEVDTLVTIDMGEVKDVFLKAGTYADYTTGTEDDKFTFDSNYYPVEFTLTNGSNSVSGTLEEIAEHINGLSGKHEAGEDLGSVYGTYTLTWTWVFPENHDQEEAKEINQKDTLLGNLAADANIHAKWVESVDSEGNTTSARFYPMAVGQEYCNNVSFDITITVTQID